MKLIITKTGFSLGEFNIGDEHRDMFNAEYQANFGKCIEHFADCWHDSREDNYWKALPVDAGTRMPVLPSNRKFLLENGSPIAKMAIEMASKLEAELLLEF